MASEPVLGFRKDGNPVTELAQIRELGLLQLAVRGEGEQPYLVTTDLKFGKVPSGILVSRALDVSERGLVGSNVAVDVERYLNFVLKSAPRLSRSSGVHTYTSRTRVSGASPPALQN